MVGYQTFGATKNNYILKSIQFDGIGGAFNIKDFTGNLVGPAYDEYDNFKSTAPQMLVRDGDGYTEYYFLSDGAWDPDANGGVGDYVPGWADATGNPLPDNGVEIPAGTAFWLVDQFSDASSITTPGEVLQDATSSVTFSSGYSLAACPYPKAIAFSDVTFAGLSGPAYDEYDNFKSTAPQMLVRDGDGYTEYYFLSDGAWDPNANGGVGDYVPGWADATGNPLPDYDAKLISVGTAFWINLQEQGANVTATFTL